MLPTTMPTTMPWPEATPLFRDRRDAGRRLAGLVRQIRPERCGPYEPLVLGLPRGGVPVAAEVSRVLGAPLEVWISRRIEAPGTAEVAIGAVSEGGELVVDPELVALSGADDVALKEAARLRQREVVEAARRLRGGRPRPHVRGRCVVLVDDGVATGLTALAALRDLERAGAARLILAVPVGAATALEELADDADEIVCAAPLEHLKSVAAQYESFPEVTDLEMKVLLDAARRRAA